MANLIEIKVIYFAILKDLSKKEEEFFSIEENNTPESLYELLKEKYSFPDHINLKVAINDSFAEWKTILNDQDIVVFIPPVTGG